MSDTIDNPHRRRLLAGATAALTAGAAIATTARAAPVATPGGAGDDAELIRLCRALAAATLAVNAIVDEPEFDQPGITPQSIDHEERLAGAEHIWWGLAQKIADTPARTLEGVQAKAGVMLSVFDHVLLPEELGSTLDDIATGDVGQLEDRMALSLARDVLAGRAAA